MRRDWGDLPESVAAMIAERVGGHQVTPAVDGDHAEIAATVTGPRGRVFVKAAVSDFGVRTLRYESSVSRTVGLSWSPAVEWVFEADGWLVVGFEHVAGGRARLHPDSPDLGLLSPVLTDLATTPAPDGLPLFSPAARLGFDHPAMHGDTLVHTDLNPANLLVTPAGLRVVDWAMATRAAPWVEPALLVAWLIGGGHTPEQAEAWLTGHPAWDATAPEVLDDFAARNAEKWSLKAQQSRTPWMQDLAAWTGSWSAYRCRLAGRGTDFRGLAGRLGVAP